MVNEMIFPAKGKLPANYDPWKRFLAAIILRGSRDINHPKYRDEATAFLTSPWVTAWLKDEFDLCLK